MSEEVEIRTIWRAAGDTDRVENGALRFGDDWPGYFIRGDNAFALYMTIMNVLNFKEDTLSQTQLKAFAFGLLDCNLNEELVAHCKKTHGLVVEQADTSALSNGEDHEETD
jgi:hypothetical protein